MEIGMVKLLPFCVPPIAGIFGWFVVGPWWAIICLTLALPASALLALSLNRAQHNKQRAGIAFAVAVSCTVLSISLFPSLVDPEIAEAGRNIREQRKICSRLESLIDSSDGENLRFSNKFKKNTHSVRILGEFQTLYSFLSFRERLLSQHPEVKRRFLYWEIDIIENSIEINETDADLKGSALGVQNSKE
jgi:hypothetical protein